VAKINLKLSLSKIENACGMTCLVVSVSVCRSIYPGQFTYGVGVRVLGGSVRFLDVVNVKL
jgi:hypothetical protein